MAAPVLVGTGHTIGEHVRFEGQATVGHATYIESSAAEGRMTSIGDRARIGAFCYVGAGSHIQNGVEIDNYCRVGADVVVGVDSKILYGVQLFNRCSVGRNCIIGGNLSERVVVGDFVTFMGALAHSHRNPNLDWDSTDEPSARIRYGSVVGVNALLIGAISVGPFSYVASGEILRHSIPPRSIYYQGKLYPLASWKGIIKVRDAHLDSQQIDEIVGSMNLS